MKIIGDMILALLGVLMMKVNLVGTLTVTNLTGAACTASVLPTACTVPAAFTAASALALSK